LVWYALTIETHRIGWTIIVAETFAGRALTHVVCIAVEIQHAFRAEFRPADTLAAAINGVYAAVVTFEVRLTLAFVDTTTIQANLVIQAAESTLAAVFEIVHEIEAFIYLTVTIIIPVVADFGRIRMDTGVVVIAVDVAVGEPKARSEAILVVVPAARAGAVDAKITRQTILIALALAFLLACAQLGTVITLRAVGVYVAVADR